MTQMGKRNFSENIECVHEPGKAIDAICTAFDAIIDKGKSDKTLFDEISETYKYLNPQSHIVNIHDRDVKKWSRYPLFYANFTERIITSKICEFLTASVKDEIVEKSNDVEKNFLNALGCFVEYDAADRSLLGRVNGKTILSIPKDANVIRIGERMLRVIYRIELLREEPVETELLSREKTEREIFKGKPFPKNSEKWSNSRNHNHQFKNKLEYV